MSRTCSVYFIGPADRAVIKIGVATKPKNRLKELQVANPETLKIHHHHRVYNKERALRLETELHKALHAFHIRGEWFAVRWEEAVAILNRGIESRKRRHHLRPQYSHSEMSESINVA